MEMLVEVKLLEEFLLITCNSNMTIAEMAQVAQAEYDTAHLNDTPKNVQHVKDSKGRILSGTIKLGSLKSHELFEIIVYDESFVQSKILEPPTLKMMHDKWAMFTVYQMEQYLNSATNSDPPVSFESRELFGLLDELKHSKSEGVQGSVVKCLELMLNNSRNVVLIKYIADELQALFELTNHEAIAISVLKHIQKLYKISKSCVKVDELMENVYTKIKSLGCNNEEFLKYCDYDIDNKKQDEKLQVKGCNSSEENERRHNLSSEMEEASNMQTAVENIDTFSSPSGRMGLSRVIELLHSDDMNCRNFALDKLIRSTSSYGLDRNGRDDIISEIRGPDEPPELLRALFACLKKSLKPPSEILAKSGTKVRQPLSFLIADKALHSPNSNFKDIFSCIKCIHWIVKKWSYDSCYDVLSMKWRILLTLTHASDRQDEDLEIAERCGELLILLTNRDGWMKYNIALERDSITYFLVSEHPLMRTILALSYVKCNFNFENEYDRSSAANDEGSVIICSNDFANLRSIWRWCVGNYSQNVCIPALEVLSSALVLSEVKSHMIKYDPLDKLLRLLENYVNIEMESRNRHNHQATVETGNSCIFIIRFSLKAIVNLNSPITLTKYTLKLERALKGTQLGSDLLLLASQDEIIGFYAKLLNNYDENLMLS